MKKNFFLSKKIKLLLLFTLLSTPLLAQYVEAKFDELTVASPNCVLQDAYGFIWIGAQEALLRYDGNTLKKYQNIPFDSTSLSANWVTSLAEDRAGNLWVGTIDGLDYFNQRTEQFTQFRIVDKNDSTLSTKLISKIVVNDDGSLWIATSDCGLFIARFNEAGRPEFSHYNLSKNISLNDSTNKLQILDLCKDYENCLWIGTMNSGLIKLDIGKTEVTHFKNDPTDRTSLSHNTVRSICPDNQGNIWIGTGAESVKNAGGLNKYDRHTGKFIHFRYNPDDPTSLFSDWVNPILIDSRGVMWMSYPDVGIAYIRLTELFENKKPNFRQSQLKKIFRVKSIYEDRMGNIWFAPTRWILYKYDPHQNPFYWYHHVEGSSNTMSCTGTQCIYVDSKQNIWFGHGNAYLDKYNPTNGIYTTYFLKSNKPTPKGFVWISSICEDTSGYFWIATLNNGLYRMDPTNEIFKKIFPDTGDANGLQTESIWYIILSKSSKLLLAPVDKDLILFDPHSYHSRIVDLNPGSTELVRISTMFEDRYGNIWLGTFTNGLYKTKIVINEVQIIEHYIYEQTNENSLSNNYVCDIIRPDVVDTNALWIATANGMNRFDLEKKTFTHFFEKDGIPDNWVLQLLEDNKGNIWITGKIGIGVYDIVKKKWKSYGLSDGLPFETFGGSRQNNTKGPDGQLFFSAGQDKGTISFYPDQIKDNPIIPPIRITDFRIFNEKAKLDTSIIFKKIINLSYDQNAFSFEFAALNYTNSGKNQYAYKMEGFHDDWIYSGNVNTASFTNLDPGEYMFRVKGSNNHGIWNEEGTFISIIITPPWWATWWFRTIVILVLIGIGNSIYRYRINKVREMERLRIQIASDLHDDIGSALTRIAVHSEIIQTTTEKEKVSSASKRIGNMSREIITTLSDVVWSIDSRNDTVGDLIDRMRDFLDTVFPAGSIHIDFQTKGLHFDQKVEQTLRQNIYLIFKEAVNNAAKHSGADKIKISMINGDGKFKLEISDNGIGMNESKMLKGHHGIENMKLRAERINGEIKIENLEKGTKIILVAKSI